jgi:DNA-binding Lrp family transcriptional regulator
VDAIDRRILAELQVEGRLTVTELAERVRLTPAPCHRRLRELERTGVITGYRAVVEPAAVGLGFEALVSVTMRHDGAGQLRTARADPHGQAIGAGHVVEAVDEDASRGLCGQGRIWRAIPGITAQ